LTASKKLKILHLVYDHPENPWCGGGGAGRTWAINEILSERHDITVLCGAFPGASEQDTPFKARYFGKAKRYTESRLKFIWASRKIDFRPYDLIVEEFSYYAPIFSRFSNHPIVTILQSRHGLKALRYHPIYGLISLISQYLLVPQRKAVIIVSEHLRPAIHPKAVVSLIPQGASIPGDLPPPAEKYVLFLGRLDIRIKGLDLLVKAWAQLPPSLLNIPLHIAGPGDETKVKRMIKSEGAINLRLLGPLNHKEALEAINQAAFVCLPSRDEGSPLVVYESLALGKPVIGTTIPALKGLIPHGTAGLLVPPEDVKSLARAIHSLLVDAGLRSRLSKGASQIGKGFHWKAVAEKQEQFYYETIHSKKY
jgi:glycosyltransferase involved in cell wall biosynthesis